MSPRKRDPTMSIAIPPRLSYGLSADSSDSSPSTPSPHTPLPYEQGFTPGLQALHTQNEAQMGGMSMTYSAAGSKRSRDEVEEMTDEISWTPEEEELIRATLIHPFRPISSPYPPGSLPPAEVLDELANQILTYGFRQSHTSSSKRGQSTHINALEGHGTGSAAGWVHSFDATRAKLFAMALAESKFGHDASERKLSRLERKERQQRPGLRRMDSMDFLDEDEGEVQEQGTADGIGKALRLSTTLQNSAKVPAPSSMPPGDLSSGPSTPLTTITLTPCSPTPPPAPQPLLRRRGSFRSASSRVTRPTSLLQRGRSFTASDLQAEQAASATPPSSQELVSSPEPSVTTPELLHAPTALELPPSRITRSLSSSVLYPDGHPARDAFLVHSPSSDDRHLLAMPLPIIRSPGRPKNAPNQRQGQGTGWSDSDDEAPMDGNRAVKKSKSGAGAGMKKRQDGHLGRIKVVGGLQGAEGDGLRSPFEEKAGLEF